MKLALCIPTRGVIFARTIESTILSPRLPPDSHVIIVAGRPIPDSHNECVRRALATDCTHIWFVEEDMDIPDRGFEIMLAYANEGAPYVAIDYPIQQHARTTVYRRGKQVLWTGFGCTLIDRKVFENYTLHDPWFTDEYEVLIEQMNPIKYTVRKKAGNLNSYGMFDIKFGLDVNDLQIPIHVIDGQVCKHLRMRSWERKENNHGIHEIYEI